MIERKSNQRGFTLIELLVVIAIIGTLMAVLVPSLANYVRRAKITSDEVDAKNMSTLVELYVYDQGIDVTELEASEIRSIINQENHYSFIPKVEGYSWWYDYATEKVVYDLAYEEIESPGDPGDKLEEIVEGRLLLDVGGSAVASAINTIRNLRTEEHYSRNMSILNSSYPKLYTHINQNFNINTTLFINDFYGFALGTASKVVFGDDIEVIPRTALKTVTSLPTSIRLPLSVSIIEEGAFQDLPLTVSLTYYDLTSISVEDNAFSDADSLNSALKAKEGSTGLRDLRIGTASGNTVTRYYGDDVYLGKKVDNYNGTTYVSTVYYDRYGEISNEASVTTDSDFSIESQERKLKVYLDPEDELGVSTGEEVYEFHMVYRDLNGTTYIEVKAYDHLGHVIATTSVAVIQIYTNISSLPV